MSFETWLDDERARRGWTRADFARRVGVTNGMMSNWLNGRRRPSAEYCERIAEALELAPEDVLQRAGRLKRPTVPPRTSDIQQALSRLSRVETQLQEELNRIRGAGYPVIDIRNRGRLPADSVRWVETREDDSTMSVPEQFLGGRSPGRVFAATVTGDCLTALHITDGSLVFLEALEPDQLPRNGQVAAVLLGDEVTLKVWHREGNFVELRDGDGQTVTRFSILDEFRVEGVLFGCFARPNTPGER